MRLLLLSHWYDSTLERSLIVPRWTPAVEVAILESFNFSFSAYTNYDDSDQLSVQYTSVYLQSTRCAHTGATRGVTVSTSAILACHQC